MRIAFAIFLLYLCNPSIAQKRSLEFADIKGWPNIKPTAISNDGKYVSYKIDFADSIDVLVVRSTFNDWEIELPKASESRFSENSRNFIFKNAGDSLGILNLENDTIQYIPNVITFKLSDDVNDQFLACMHKEPEDSLELVSLKGTYRRFYPHVNDYDFYGSQDLIIGENTDLNGNTPSLSCIKVHGGKRIFLCHDCITSRLSFDGMGTKCVFLADGFKNKRSDERLMYFGKNMDSAMTLIDSLTPGMENMRICTNQDIYFSKDGDAIFFSIQRRDRILAQPVKISEQMDIRSYREDNLYTVDTAGPFLAVIRLNEPYHHVSFLQRSGDNSISLNVANEQYALVERDVVGFSRQQVWNVFARPNVYLENTIDGNRKLVKRRLITLDINFSLNGNYMIWYDSGMSQWFIYDIAGSAIKCITNRIPSKFYDEDLDISCPRVPYGKAGWLKNDRAVLLYDRYDIWEVDPKGLRAPVNLTHGYGRKNDIQLRLIDFHRDRPLSIQPGDTLLLSAFNIKTKENGFFKLSIEKSNHLDRLAMESRSYYFPSRYTSAFSSDTDPLFPLKSRDANVFLFRRTSSGEFPNLYVTADFRIFRPLTNFEPQNRFIWYKSELIHWNLDDGRRAEGILFKPENFDSTKTYPLIFYYYERSADALNVYIDPALSDGTMNIPSFVSNGYLVFVPDIYYKSGYPGNSAYRSVTSAAAYLSMKHWVDSKHLGLQGHSFGGFETNYIVTHTNQFAAAAESAGVSDLISAYTKSNNKWYYENGQGRMGAGFWDRPDFYIHDSPIFQADKVKTPILIMHNRKDPIVDFSQAQEWFGALSGLHKTVWMLSYNGETHIIHKANNQLDYSIRLRDFFDHYLKGSPLPDWMK